MSSITQKVTDAILQELRQGVIPWHKPWSLSPTSGPSNPLSGTQYRGANWLLLSAIGGIGSRWVTFKQVIAAGGSIRKGSKAVPVLYWGKTVKKHVDESGEEVIDNTFVFPRSYLVFPVDAVEGVEFKEPEVERSFEPLAFGQDVMNGMMSPSEGDPLHYSEFGVKAFYRPSADSVVVPPRATFESETAFYNVIFHETIHATMHPSRLDRKEGLGNIFGSAEYAFEELVAEMGAAMLCAHAGIDSVSLPHSAAYISSWIEKLEGDEKFVVMAAQKAQKAVDFVLANAFPESAKALLQAA